MKSEPIDMLVAMYRDYADAHGAATERGDHKAANKNHDRLIALVPKLRAAGSEGESALRRLMKDESAAVGCWAATHSLLFAEADALSVLDALAQKPGAIGFGAKMVAQQWRAGNLVIP